MISGDRKDAFVQARLNNLKPYIGSLEPVEVLKKGVEAHLDELLELGEISKCQKGADFFKLPGIQAEDFKERVISLEDGGEVLVGIRFRGLNTEEAFVHFWPNFSDFKRLDFMELRQIAKREFGKFSPKWFALALSPGRSFQGENYFEDLLTVLGEVKLLSRDVFFEDVQIEQVSKVDFYGHYLDEYHRFHQSVPRLKKEVKPEKKEDLEISAKSGLLFKIHVGSKFAGIISGLEEKRFGISGVCVLEKFLFENFRAKGLSTGVQKLFINQLERKGLKTHF